MTTVPQNKIILVFPRTGQDVYGINVGLPIGVLSLATVLKTNGFTPVILDERVEARFAERLVEEIDENVLFAGISAKTGHQIRGGLEAADRIRQTAPELPLVWGGVHPSLVPESTLAHPLVDIVCIGEGEETVVELARALARDGHPGHVPGLMYVANGEIIRTPDRGLIEDLDTLPVLDYSLLDVRDYMTIGHILREPQLQLCTSRGCPFRCGYCYNILFNKRTYRAMSPERTFEEIRRVHDEFGVRSVFFYDDYFFGRRERAVRLLDLLETNRLSMKFEVSCRVDFIDRADIPFLERLRRNGFQELLIGIESGNDDILKLMQKDFTVEQVLRINHKLAQVGINSKYSFMAGFPGESRDQILDTVQLMRRLLRENPHASLTPLGIYTPYPGTRLFDRCIEAGMTNFPQTLDEWADYNWVEARHSFLSDRQIVFLNRLNVMSRFFDRHAFERFGNRFLRPLVMFFYDIYRLYGAFRLKTRFFALMPEVSLINRFQQMYVDRLHSRLLEQRTNLLQNRPG